MKILAIAALLLGAAPASAAEAPLAPSGKWSIDYGAEACTLSHDFGTGTSLVTMAFRTVPLSDDMSVIMIAAGDGPPLVKTKAKLTLQPSGKSFESEVTLYGVPTKKQMVATLRTNAEILSMLQSASAVTIDVAGAPRRTVAFPDIAGASGAMKSCQADLLKSWGLDPMERDRIKTLPVAIKPESWIAAEDYPAAAFKISKQGTATIVWAVGADGKVSDCRVVDSSGSKDLDDAGCLAIKKRGRYAAAATGKDGKPILSHQARKVVWSIPK